jgi:uncharacterized protein YxjI
MPGRRGIGGPGGPGGVGGPGGPGGVGGPGGPGGPGRRDGVGLLGVAVVAGTTAAVVGGAKSQPAPAAAPAAAPDAAAGGAPGGGAHRYQMREKLASIGDDFWIENGAGQRVYKVDGKALRVRDTLKLKDMQGNVVAEIQEKIARIKDTMDIARNGQKIATVKQALITPLRGRFSVNVAGGADMDVQGNILAHDYKFEQGGRQIAEVSKKWFRVRDSYGVDIQPGQDDALILAVTVVIDQMTSDIG